MRKKSIIIHPFIFAILPIISLVSHNIESVAIKDIFRPVILSLIATSLLLVLFWVVVKDFTVSGIITTLVLIFFFSYGHVYGGFLHFSLVKLMGMGGFIGRHNYLLIGWILLLGLCIWIIIRLKRYALDISNGLNLIGIVVLVMPLYGILRYEYYLRQPWSNHEISTYGSNQLLDTDLTNKPDIYYIILDGYARSDILQDIYDFDNSSFINYLEDRGFFVAEKSRSNYVQTVLSLSASLNMEYLDYLTDQVGDSSDRSPTTRLIRWNVVRRLLEKNGYKTVTMSTGYRATEFENADIFIQSPQTAVTPFEKLVIETSALVLIQEVRRLLGLSSYYPGYKSHSDRIIFAMDSLSTLHKINGPKFVFVHIIAPHPPFVFNEVGALLEQKYPFYILDGSAYLGTTEEYINGYRGQINYINREMQDVIESILDNSEIQPIIIIQADHGPGSGFDWESPDNNGLQERVAILNAYYLPENRNDKLYESISPVNTFRLIFNEYFGGDYTFLPDESFYSNWMEPYQFMQIK